ncbi:hypothetical protein ACE193_24860 [Bernardetia sp. OM2101]|uniref:hypothetical protein n=1 Tax=Bernardetia sp. OM2101 TaxID=3344876 RepID=UPI0035CEA51C
MNNLRDIIFALQQKNLVYNGDFLLFSNKQIEDNKIKAYNHPDGWIYQNEGKGANIELQNNSCVITVNSVSENYMIFKQQVNEFPRWEDYLKGKTVTAKIHISVPQNTVISFSLSDGVIENKVTNEITKETDYEIELAIEVSASAKNLTISLESKQNNAVITINKIYANIGKVALENLTPMVLGVIGERKQYIATQNPPACELSICNESKSLNDNYTRLNSVLNGRFGKSTDGYSLLPDIRGYFSRAWNNKSNIDKTATKRTQIGSDTVLGDKVGTQEQEHFLAHTHELKFDTRNVSVEVGATPIIVFDIVGKSETKLRGDEETNPINFSELYTIKWS